MDTGPSRQLARPPHRQPLGPEHWPAFLDPLWHRLSLARSQGSTHTAVLPLDGVPRPCWALWPGSRSRPTPPGEGMCPGEEAGPPSGWAPPPPPAEPRPGHPGAGRGSGSPRGLAGSQDPVCLELGLKPGSLLPSRPRARAKPQGTCKHPRGGGRRRAPRTPTPAEPPAPASGTLWATPDSTSPRKVGEGPADSERRHPARGPETGHRAGWVSHSSHAEWGLRAQGPRRDGPAHSACNAFWTSGRPPGLREV